MSAKPSIQSDSGNISVVIIGAGHAGLAVSHCLNQQSIDHVVLERGEVANAWQQERWTSLRLLTPNWQNNLPGFRYQGNDPDGFMTRDDVAAFINDYAKSFDAPVRTQTTVKSVTRRDDDYHVVTDRGEWYCQALVLASGACNVASKPSLATQIPAGLLSLTPLDYRDAGQLPEGDVLIIGGSATGLQFAEEISRSGRQVTLSVDEHVRLPRRYRNRDIHWWMDRAGVLDQRIEDQLDPNRARRVPSPQLVGSAEGRNLDLNALQAAGVEVVGRLAGMRDGWALFSGSLRNCCAMADQKQTRLLELLDNWASQCGLENQLAAPERPAPTKLPARPRLQIDLDDGRFSTVIWATGFRPDYSWLHLPVIDRKGALVHDRGVVGTPESNTPGLFAMGLGFMRRRKSGFIHGAKDDARDIAQLMKRHLDNFAQARPGSASASASSQRARHLNSPLQARTVNDSPIVDDEFDVAC